jgi:murein L,D-transpeptidase YcbB/YkuD
MLHTKFKLDPDNFILGGNTVETAGRGLHFHKEDKATTHKTCPGKNINKVQLVFDVQLAMGNTAVAPTPAPVTDPATPHTHDVPVASQEADTSKLNSVELVSIYWLQAALNQWSPSLHLAVNGQRDKPTVEAIQLFQTSHGLKVDGVGGPVTRIAIKLANA